MRFARWTNCPTLTRRGKSSSCRPDKDLSSRGTSPLHVHPPDRHCPASRRNRRTDGINGGDQTPALRLFVVGVALINLANVLHHVPLEIRDRLIPTASADIADSRIIN